MAQITLNSTGVASSGALVLQSNGTTEQARIDTNGNLGIGTSSPSSPLTISKSNATAIAITSGATYPVNAYGATTGATTFAIANSGGTSYFGNESSTASTTFSGTSAYATILGTGATTSLQFVTNGTVRTTLDSSGNLGIGTTSPTFTNGKGISILDGTTSRLKLATTASGSGATDGFELSCNGSEAYIYNYENSFMAFGTNSTERARIDTSGNLLVGTTTAGYANSNSMALLASSGYGIVNHLSGTSSGSSYMAFGYNASPIGSISQSGTTAVLYNVTSDQRLKENIQDADSASSLIDSLQVRKFDWKTDQTHQRYGFVAQELVTVAPEAVHQPTDTEEMMAVDYSKLVPMLVKEVQSLRKRLAAAGI